MEIYKFKDTVDGNFAFVAAKTHEEATETLQKLTSIPFALVESKALEEINRPIVLINKILPF